MTVYNIWIKVGTGEVALPRPYHNQLHAEAVSEIIATLAGCETKVRGCEESSDVSKAMLEGVENILNAMEGSQ